MSEEALVTAAEIARMANVGRAAVSNWRRRHPDFPEPVVGPGGSPAFRLDEVEDWLRRQGKLTGSDPADALWLALDAGRTEADALELVADLATHLRDPRAAEPPEQVRDLLGGLADAPREELVESLTDRVFERQQRQHLVTPAKLARLMVELAAPVAGTVFDPACGPGNVLRAAAEAGADRLVGQEINPVLTRLALARLGARLPSEVVAGDALRADAFPDLRADAVICDPPFGYRDWGHEELALDPRWEYGFPVKGEPELAWLQHCLAHAKPDAPVVLALPAGVAFRRPGRAIRQALLRRGAVRAVIALPAGILMSTGIPIHLWVLRRPGAGASGPVLLVDASHHQPSRRGRVNWSALAGEVLDAWREFRDTGAVAEVTGRQKTFEPIELLDEDVDLTPARHLPQPQPALDPDTLERTRADLADLLGELSGLLPDFHQITPDARATTTVNDLARAGALALRQQVGPLPTDEAGSGPPVLTGRDVVTGTPPAARFAGTEDDDPIHLRPGDLVIPMLIAGDGRPRVLVVDTDDLILGPNLHLIRVDSGRLDTHFLAGQLRAADPSRLGGTTLSGVHRVDVRRMEIPVLPLERQQRIGAAFRRLEAFESGLRRAAALGADLVKELSTGLARGAVAPPE
ncbi:N-6 DNA methylase [Saccharothrix coeruleofusca]|uniref:Type II restriction endonuclease subunit M n=1 Tax=Saccharothrix coeruleofusca TaxID=33919 RepID=A0A918ATF8_9PSEU|nr:N-6 DNA methylase [Saccharothrix coeruleofusca]GGP85722.1 type II restriction endonuclease subunit M [Saccharothrix coeruleofusca]